MARRLELMDRIAETCGHPHQQRFIVAGAVLRRELMAVYTHLHSLEARLPTPELLSERAYNRMLMLGMSEDAAEAGRVHAYRQAAHNQRYQHAA